MLRIFFFIALFVLCSAVGAQNVGIGTTTPSRAKLEVHGSVGGTAALFGGETTGISFQGSNPAVGFNHYFSAGSKWISNGYAAVQYIDPATGYMELDMFPNGLANNSTTSYVQAMTITSNGNMGIRTYATNATLYAVKAGNFDGSAVFGTAPLYSHFQHSFSENTYIRAGKAGSTVYINDIPSAKIIIGSGNSYVGINTASPVYPLEIRQTASTGVILVEPSQTFNNWEQYVGDYDGFQSSLKLIYNGQLKTYFRPTDGELITVSDRRLKENIRAIPSILGKIMLLRPVAFDMKDDVPAQMTSIGFIAQEVKAVFPQLVKIHSSSSAKRGTIDNLHSLDYHSFKILAVKAVQEEQLLIDNLLEKQIALKARLDQVEKKLGISN
jgi:Chaperone of endosialidase